MDIPPHLDQLHVELLEMFRSSKLLLLMMATFFANEGTKEKRESATSLRTSS